MKKNRMYVFCRTWLNSFNPREKKLFHFIFQGGVQIKNNISESEILYLRFRRAMPKKNKNRVRKIIEFGSPGQMQIISQNYCKAQLYLYKNFGWIGNSPSIFFF